MNVPDAIVRDGRVYKVFTDSRGSPLYVVNVTDPSDVLLDAEYDVFGKVTSFTSSEKDGNGKSVWPIPFGFAGGLYDADTGFVRFGAREYDPSVGRWTSKDPILFAGGQGNLFVYVNGDPVNFVDPEGLASDCGGGGCFSKCMAAQGADYVLGAMGFGAPSASLLPKFGRDAAIAARTGATTTTSAASWAARALKATGAVRAGVVVRAIGRRLNPISNAVIVFGASYLGTSAAICAVECGGA